jgi:hypothetical protein
LTEQATHLGAGIGAMETPDVPRYPEMIHSVLTEAGWIGTTFDIYHVRVRYPIMHTLIHIQADTVKKQVRACSAQMQSSIMTSTRSIPAHG